MEPPSPVNPWGLLSLLYSSKTEAWRGWPIGAGEAVPALASLLPGAAGSWALPGAGVGAAAAGPGPPPPLPSYPPMHPSAPQDTDWAPWSITAAECERGGFRLGGQFARLRIPALSLTALTPWAGEFPPLSLSFLVCKMGMVYPYLAGGREDQMREYVRCPEHQAPGEEAALPRSCRAGLPGPPGGAHDCPPCSTQTWLQRGPLAPCLLNELRPACCEFNNGTMQGRSGAERGPVSKSGLLATVMG